MGDAILQIRAREAWALAKSLPQLTQEGRWMGAVLACGREAWLSHPSAAALWTIRFQPPGAPIHVSFDAAVVRRIPGIRVHRTTTLTDSDLTTHRGIPVTTPTRTLIDLASGSRR